MGRSNGNAARMLSQSAQRVQAAFSTNLILLGKALAPGADALQMSGLWIQIVGRALRRARTCNPLTTCHSYQGVEDGRSVWPIFPAHPRIPQLMDQKPLNVGIIGYGWAATAHIDAVNATNLAAEDESLPLFAVDCSLTAVN